jgi:hypothetical protein
MKNIPIDNIHLINNLDEKYKKAFDEFYKVLVKEYKSNEKINIIANIAIDDLVKANNKNQEPDVILNPSRKYRAYLKAIDNSNKYKETKKKIIKEDNEKITISGIWLVFSLCIVFMFIKCIITQKYLINFSIDLVFASIALLLSYRNIKVRYKILKRYHLEKYLRFDIMCLILCIISKFIVSGNFDVSYLILVINYFITKKKIEEDLKKLS